MAYFQTDDLRVRFRLIRTAIIWVIVIQRLEERVSVTLEELSETSFQLLMQVVNALGRAIGR